MDMVFGSLILLENLINMKVLMLMIKSVDMDNLNGAMVLYIKETILMIVDKDMEKYIKTEFYYIKVNGIRVHNVKKGE